MTEDIQEISLKIADFLNNEIFSQLNYRQQVGFFGQQIAKQYLLNKDYEVLSENFFVKGGELDLVARLSGRVHIIEVKTRTTLAYGELAEAIHIFKIEKLVKGGQIFMSSKGWLEKIPWQIDGITVFIDKKKGNILLRYYQNISPLY